jgi:signal transduction histidine kinase
MEAAALPRADRESIYESLVANTENLRDFVERLLTLARAGKAIGHRMKIPVALVAEKAFAAAAAAHDDAELTLEKPFPLVTCDPDAMEQVFFNLFSNALVHIPAGKAPRLEVRYEVKRKSIDIMVKDNGTGISPGVLPRIFDVTCTTNEKSRFGFGLAIVKKLVEAHGGSVRAESGGPGQGSTFSITLPHL